MPAYNTAGQDRAQENRGQPHRHAAHQEQRYSLTAPPLQERRRMGDPPPRLGDIDLRSPLGISSRGHTTTLASPSPLDLDFYPVISAMREQLSVPTSFPSVVDLRLTVNNSNKNSLRQRDINATR